VTRTVVFLHAHPDDESLLTGGTMARLAAEGHRVVLVTATAGEYGLASQAVHAAGSLGEQRRAELVRAARILGVADLVLLGYADSGMADAASGSPPGFAGVDVERAASRVAELLRGESADVLVAYDAAGGYGHPDHVQVHRVGLRAAELARTPVVMEATLDRRALQRGLRRIHRCTGGQLAKRVPALDSTRYENLFSDPDLLTHRVDVRGYLEQKRAAMRAHVSQSSSDDGTRLLANLLRLPAPLFRHVLGHEWFVAAPRRS